MNDENDITLDTEDNIDDSVVAEEAQGETIKKLRTRLKDAEGKAKEHLDNWQRAQAEFVNVRKRDEEAKGEFLKFAKADLVAQVIPVLDSFSSALAHGQKEVEPIYNQLTQILKQNGLEEVEALGKPFDPMHHEALGVVHTGKPEEDHQVLEVLQKGYIMMGKVIRPAKVRIGEFSK